MEQMGYLLEIAMMVCFGFSWPSNIRTTLKNRSTKGKSLAFLLMVDAGYLCGILGKILSGNVVWYILAMYILNFSMVATDIFLYLHFKSLEKKHGVC